jgi:hypothetical protein
MAAMRDERVARGAWGLVSKHKLGWEATDD